MSQDAVKGTKATSDESNSTEHDATVSLSGTDDVNDAHSVFSDSVSLPSKASKLNDAKKLIYKMNKLKEENLVLKESLEKANATDITMLKSKLRGSNADMVRLRQNNLELKDRIQILEGRLFNALSAQSTKGNVDVGEGPIAMPPLTSGDFGAAAAQPDNRFTSSERAHLMDTIRSLQTRCKHLARLVQSYETKISAMQAETDASISGQKHDDAAPPPNHTLEFTVIEDDGPVAMNLGDDAQPSKEPLKSALKGGTTQSMPLAAQTLKKAGERKRVQIQQSEVDAQIQQARASDAKMIRELSEEVKRLVALLPRDKIQDTEDLANGTTINESDEESETEPAPPSRSAQGTEQKKTTNSNRSIARPTISNRDGERAEESKVVTYGPGQVLGSFFAGVLVMLLCVALSGFSAYGRRGGGDTGGDGPEKT